MPTPLSVPELPGSENARLFEGRDHGATVSCFLTTARPGFRVDLHRHPYEETFIVHQGAATFTVDEETIEAHAGEIVIVPAGAVHGFVSSGEEMLLQTSIHPSDHVIQEWLEE